MILTTPPKKQGDFDMSRLSMDALVVQTKLGDTGELTIDHIAKEVFGETSPGGAKVATPISRHRALRAAKNLATMKQVKLLMESSQITGIRSTGTQGRQAQALMNMAVRSGVDRRREERDTPDRRGESVEPE